MGKRIQKLATKIFAGKNKKIVNSKEKVFQEFVTKIQELNNTETIIKVLPQNFKFDVENNTLETNIDLSSLELPKHWAYEDGKLSYKKKKMVLTTTAFKKVETASAAQEAVENTGIKISVAEILNSLDMESVNEVLSYLYIDGACVSNEEEKRINDAFNEVKEEIIKFQKLEVPKEKDFASSLEDYIKALEEFRTNFDKHCENLKEFKSQKWFGEFLQKLYSLEDAKKEVTGLIDNNVEKIEERIKAIEFLLREEDLEEYRKFVKETLGKQQTPGGAEQTPGGAEQTPGGAEQTPGGAEQTPGGAEQTPGGAEQTPGGAEQTPGGAEQTPGGAEQTPGGAEQTPGGAEQTPGGAEQTPGGAEQTPGGAEQTPGGAQQTPGGTQQTPDKVNEYLQIIEQIKRLTISLCDLDNALLQTISMNSNINIVDCDNINRNTMLRAINNLEMQLMNVSMEYFQTTGLAITLNEQVKVALADKEKAITEHKEALFTSDAKARMKELTEKIKQVADAISTMADGEEKNNMVAYLSSLYELRTREAILLIGHRDANGKLYVPAEIIKECDAEVLIKQAAAQNLNGGAAENTPPEEPVKKENKVAIKGFELRTKKDNSQVIVFNAENEPVVKQIPNPIIRIAKQKIRIAFEKEFLNKINEYGLKLKKITVQKGTTVSLGELNKEIPKSAIAREEDFGNKVRMEFENANDQEQIAIDYIYGNEEEAPARSR